MTIVVYYCATPVHADRCCCRSCDSNADVVVDSGCHQVLHAVHLLELYSLDEDPCFALCQSGSTFLIHNASFICSFIHPLGDISSCGAGVSEENTRIDKVRHLCLFWVIVSGSCTKQPVHPFTFASQGTSKDSFQQNVIPGHMATPSHT